MYKNNIKYLIMNRDYIIKSNKASRSLVSAGFSLQGRTKGMESVAVEKNNKIQFFKDYIEAENSLINNK